jgi:ribosomal protein S18 acetylase RimI-like enzyme
MSMVYQADITRDSQRIQELFTELSLFILDNISQRFGVGTESDAQNWVAGWMADLEKFCPPKGGLVVAEVDNEIVGVCCLGSLEEQIGHIRHFYVQPQYRRLGLGRKIMEILIEQSKVMGHKIIRLDTGWFMEAAQALYHSAGFKNISPYPGTEVPEELHPYWIFMEKDLTAQTTEDIAQAHRIGSPADNRF